MIRLAAVPVAIALIATAAVGRTATIRVHSGDTLSQLAVTHHTTVSKLRQLNHIPANSSLIIAGQKLLIPAAGPRPAKHSTHTASSTHKAAASSHTRVITYTVRSGDYLSAIANHYKVSVAAIASRNHLRTTNLIFVGQRLRIAVRVKVSNPHNSFAGRTYPDSTVAAADHNRAALARHRQPTRAQTRAMIIRTARAWGLNPALALAIGWQESGFQQRVVSPANAIGVMQVVPSTGRYISRYLVGRHLDLLDPADNITAGVALLNALVRAAPLDKAIAGYYQGIESVMSRGMYADTKVYVRSVLRLRHQFSH